MQLTSQSSGPLQLEGVNGKVPNQTEQSKPLAKKVAGFQSRKKKSMGQRMIAQGAQTFSPASANSPKGSY
jgi:hypothetical protein